MRIAKVVATVALSVTLFASSSLQVLAASPSDTVSEYYETEKDTEIETFESYSEIVDLVTRRANNSGLYTMDVMLNMEAAAPSSITAGVQNDAAESISSSDFSVTNTQILGIDEADTIKTDGEYLYTLSGDSVVIVKASGSDMTLMSSIEVDSGAELQEFYVTGTRLVLIGSEYKEYPLPKIPAKENDESGNLSLSDDIFVSSYRHSYVPDTWGRSSTVYYIYDVSDKESPVLLQRYALSGTNMFTRLIGDKLYYAVEYTPVYSWLYDVFNEAGVDIPGEMIIPTFSKNDSEFMPALGSIYYFSNSDSYSFISMGMLDVMVDGELRPKVYFGNGDTFYMDYENIVISCGVWSFNSYSTYLYRFSIGEHEIEYLANARLSGQVIDQYSLDVHEGNVRVATSNRNGGNEVSVFNKDMELIGATDKFAKGETIRSARFIGDMAYVVTFQTVDPLFCIDLSDPADPTILGELKIPGFSQYLHPIGDGLLIGFGRDTEENERGGFNDVGMKVSLFDINDPHDPIELDALRFSGDEYYSETFTNPKSLFTDPAKRRFGFSVICAEEAKFNPEISNSSDLEKIYDSLASKIWYGLVFIDVENGKLVKSGAVPHGRFTASRLRDLAQYSYDPFGQFTVRAVYIGDILYTAGDGKIRANDYKTFDLLNTLEID